MPVIGPTVEADKAIQNIDKLTTENRINTFRLAAETIIKHGTRKLVETGCWRGTFADGCSTVVLASIAKHVGGMLDSYELSPENIETSKWELTKRGLLQYVRFHQGDSITNLARRTEPIGFAYLDSYDCGMQSHRPSQEHQLAELEAIYPLLEKRASVLLDDNMESRGGKTRLSVRRLYNKGWKNLAYDYQILFANENTEDTPPVRFGVICGHLESFVEIAVDTIYRNKGIYCVEHGYDLRVVRGIKPKWANLQSHAKGFSWSRMEEMLDLVTCGKYEWVWCIGGDTMITNMTVTLESLLEGVGNNKHLIICPEAVAPIQADSFLVRCSQEGADYLRDILGQYERYKTHIWVENQAMIDRRIKHEPITQIMPQHRMNSYQYNLYFGYTKYRHLYQRGNDANGRRGQWKPGDFVVHWPATSKDQRLQLIKEYKPRVIPTHLKIMIVHIVHTHIVGKGSENAPPPEHYKAGSERFLKSYLAFKPDVPHELVIAHCNIGTSNGMFNGIASKYFNYNGYGWDCGAWQHAAASLECDLMICCNSFSYFWRKDWIEPFIAAYREFGAGLYGASASYE